MSRFLPNDFQPIGTSEAPRRCATPKCGRACEPSWLPYCQHCFATDPALVRLAAEYRARVALRRAAEPAGA